MLAGERGLTQDQVQGGAELAERPLGPGVGRVPQRPGAPVDPDGNGLGTVVGAHEGALQVADRDPVPIADRVPGQGGRARQGRPLLQPAGSVYRDPRPLGDVAGEEIEPVEIGPVIGVGMAQHHAIDRARVDEPLQVGEGAGAGIHQQGGRRRPDQVAAPRSAGAGPAPVAAQNQEREAGLPALLYEWSGHGPSLEVDDVAGPGLDHIEVVGPCAGGKVLPAGVGGHDDDGPGLDRSGTADGAGHGRSR